jgi:hypothetical protein
MLAIKGTAAPQENHSRIMQSRFGKKGSHFHATGEKEKGFAHGDGNSTTPIELN